MEKLFNIVIGDYSDDEYDHPTIYVEDEASGFREVGVSLSAASSCNSSFEAVMV